MANDGNLCDLDYANNFVRSFECTEHAQPTLDRLARTVVPFGTLYFLGRSYRLNVSSS